MNNKSSADQTSDSSSHPVATVDPAGFSFAEIFNASYMWIVAAVCLLVAIGLVWWSIPERGIEILIHFPEGHGLKPEDSVRFRGIDVGIVDQVELNRELSGVDVSVNLFPFAEPLAREGTRFWIVRPQLSVGAISGLETAVGHKYIGLIPGDPDGSWKTTFDGLSSEPPDALENSGIEIIVRGDDRHSVSSGSPITCRGVVVGRVLSVGLSQDGRFVDARLRIFDNYTKLVTTKTKFWASSGVDVDFSLRDGFSLDMESVETLVKGGVSMLTVENGGQPINPGHVFSLVATPEPEWFETARFVQATDVELRGAVPLEATWRHKGLIRKSDRSINFLGTLARHGESIQVLVPCDMLVLPAKGIPETLQIGFADAPITQVAVPSQDETESQLAWLPIPVGGLRLPTPLKKDDFRVADSIEPCIAVRATGELNELTYLHYPIETENLNETWSVKNFDGDRSVWHGAPVFSESDGKLIGVLIVEKRQTRIALLNDELVN